MENENFRMLTKGAAELGILLTNEHILTFHKYLKELKAWANRVDLVNRVDDREIILKDFLDSLTILKYLWSNSSVADLGSGAGFPGVPAKIARPDLRVVLLEATRKKVYFLKSLVRRLGLPQIEVCWTGGKGEIREDHAGTFDFVVSRAFGTLRNFSNTGIPLLKREGILLAMKGKKGPAELKEDLPSLEKIGLELAFLSQFRLPFLGHERSLIGLRKKRS